MKKFYMRRLSDASVPRKDQKPEAVACPKRMRDDWREFNDRSLSKRSVGGMKKWVPYYKAAKMQGQ